MSDGVLVVVLAGDRGNPRCPDESRDGVDGDDARALLGRLVGEEIMDRLGRLGRRQDRGGLAVVEDGVQAVGVAGLIRRKQRHSHVAGVQRGEEADDVFERLRGQDRDAVAVIGHLLRARGDGS